MEDAGDAKGAVTKSRLPTEHVLQGSLSTKEAKSGRASPTDASEKRSMGAPVKSYLVRCLAMLSCTIVRC